MLVVLARNVYTDQHEVADYHVRVLINERVIWEGMVVEHLRPDGAAALLERIASDMRRFPSKASPAAAGGSEEENTDKPKELEERS